VALESTCDAYALELLYMVVWHGTREHLVIDHDANDGQAIHAISAPLACAFALAHNQRRRSDLLGVPASLDSVVSRQQTTQNQNRTDASESSRT
jgi:hypothetical protein